KLAPSSSAGKKMVGSRPWQAARALQLLSMLAPPGGGSEPAGPPAAPRLAPAAPAAQGPHGRRHEARLDGAPLGGEQPGDEDGRVGRGAGSSRAPGGVHARPAGWGVGAGGAAGGAEVGTRRASGTRPARAAARGAVRRSAPRRRAARRRRRPGSGGARPASG